MVQNFALAAIVALFATATLAETTEAPKKDEQHTVEAGKDATDATVEKKTDEAKK